MSSWVTQDFRPLQLFSKGTSDLPHARLATERNQIQVGSGGVGPAPMLPCPPERGWPVPDIPIVTHSGIIRLPGLEITVHVLSNGQRVIPQDDLRRFIDWLESGGDPTGCDLDITNLQKKAK